MNGITEFEKLHVFGLSGLFKVYGRFTVLKRLAFYLSLIPSLILSLVYFFVIEPSDLGLSLINKILETGFGIISSLIGLSLAGLVLIVSFGNISLLKSLVVTNIKKAQRNKKEVGFSSYQTLIAKFTYAVFIQSVTLLSYFFIYIIVNFNIELSNFQYVFYMNLLTFLFILFFIVYSIVLLAHMIINIFTIAQMNHMVIFKEVIDEEVGKD